MAFPWAIKKDFMKNTKLKKEEVKKWRERWWENIKRWEGGNEVTGRPKTTQMFLFNNC